MVLIKGEAPSASTMAPSMMSGVTTTIPNISEDASSPRPKPPATRRKAWTRPEDDKLLKAVEQETPGAINWHRVAARVGTKRSNKDVRKRWLRRIESCRIARGPWLPEEDDRLRQAIVDHGPKWVLVANAVATRNSEQCSKRWHDVLDPNICRDSFTPADDEKLLQEVKRQGRAWSKLASHTFRGRTGIGLKNRYEYLIRQQAQEAVKQSQAGSSSAVAVAKAKDTQSSSAAAPAPVSAAMESSSSSAASSTLPSPEGSPLIEDGASFTPDMSDWSRSSFSSTTSSISSFDSNDSSFASSPANSTLHSLAAIPSDGLLSSSDLELFFENVLMNDVSHIGTPFQDMDSTFFGFPSSKSVASQSPMVNPTLMSTPLDLGTTSALPTTPLASNAESSVSSAAVSPGSAPPQAPVPTQVSAPIPTGLPMQQAATASEPALSRHGSITGSPAPPFGQLPFPLPMSFPGHPQQQQLHIPISSDGHKQELFHHPHHQHGNTNSIMTSSCCSCSGTTSSSSIPASHPLQIFQAGPPPTSMPMAHSGPAQPMPGMPSMASAPAPAPMTHPLILAPAAPGQAWSCTIVNGLPEFRLIPYGNNEMVNEAQQQQQQGFAAPPAMSSTIMAS
ncbi:hypothetical protein V8E36_003548 [Tilletia maclaganii]